MTLNVNGETISCYSAMKEGANLILFDDNGNKTAVITGVETLEVTDGELIPADPTVEEQIEANASAIEELALMIVEVLNG